MFLSLLQFNITHRHHPNILSRMLSTLSPIRIFPILLLLVTSHGMFLPSLVVNTTKSMQKAIVQQNLDIAPPFPILEIGLEHMLGQIGVNATTAENNSMAGIVLLRAKSSKPSSLQIRDTTAQCGPGMPCSDGSCCNSVSESLLLRRQAMLTMEHRKENVDSRHTIASTRPPQPASPTATQRPCAVSILSMERRNAP
jgi:hypothetical protein